MALQAKVRYPRIEIAKTKSKITRAMNDAVMESLRTWVIATTDHVPVWTGASKASFIKLAREVSVALTIIPRTVSRIEFGIETSIGEIFTNKGNTYGWLWRSELVYIHIVDMRTAFLAAGEAALKNQKPITLPSPVHTSQRD